MNGLAVEACQNRLCFPQDGGAEFGCKHLRYIDKRRGQMRSHCQIVRRPTGRPSPFHAWIYDAGITPLSHQVEVYHQPVDLRSIHPAEGGCRGTFPPLVKLTPHVRIDKNPRGWLRRIPHHVKYVTSRANSAARFQVFRSARTSANGPLARHWADRRPVAKGAGRGHRQSPLEALG